MDIVAEANRHEPGNSWPAGEVGPQGEAIAAHWQLMGREWMPQMDQAELFPLVEQQCPRSLATIL